MPDESVKIPVSIEEEMRKSYMDYAMSVIIGHARREVLSGATVLRSEGKDEKIFVSSGH